jgi:hypothetical protein
MRSAAQPSSAGIIISSNSASRSCPVGPARRSWGSTWSSLDLTDTD